MIRLHTRKVGIRAAGTPHNAHMYISHISHNHMSSFYKALALQEPIPPVCRLVRQAGTARVLPPAPIGAQDCRSGHDAAIPLADGEAPAVAGGAGESDIKSCGGNAASECCMDVLTFLYCVTLSFKLIAFLSMAGSCSQFCDTCFIKLIRIGI